MRFATKNFICRPLALLMVSCLPANSLAPTARDDHEYERGVPFVTDGAIPGGPCLRIFGHVTSPDFFIGLKRVSVANGYEFRRGKQIVTEFPEQLALQFQIRDIPCPDAALGDKRKYLTPELVSPLILSLYWKRGFALRKVEKATPVNATIQKIEPSPWLRNENPNYPDKFIWSYDLTVRTAGVPLTDHLILVVRTPERKLVARVSARM
jgi:hypothetical protein